MTASTIVDIAIGMSFVFVLLSVMGSAVTEAISGVFSLRALTLRQAVERLFKDQTLTRKLYEHPLIDGLTKDDDSDPAYIPSDLFARALVDVITRWDDNTDRAEPPAYGGVFRIYAAILKRSARKRLAKALATQEPRKLAQKSPTTFDELKRRLAEAKNFNEDTRAAISAILDECSIKSLDEAYERIAAWFDRSMESVSGWYKRSVQVLISTVALFLAVGLNVDTFVLVDSLSRDAVLRSSVAAAVEAEVKNGSAQYRTVEAVVQAKKAEAQAAGADAAAAAPAPDAAPAPKPQELIRTQVADIKRGLDTLTLPVGWPESESMICRPQADGSPCDKRTLPVTFGGWVRRLGGWLFTAIAISLGAPFWFDLLNKLINLRAAAPPPAKVTPRARATTGVSAALNEPVQQVVRPEQQRPSVPAPLRSDVPPAPPPS
ncbi:hypothetical protein [Polyangium aurulentum]|uniref:hypothetical protein n=1 Tax=Polyangium aurulentum TaxID=2567896 RepID=UPI0010ADA926|nr:hypothetical protein [Polyangium aurulentum]UQA54822.1 hypothetical protein E8A73_026000 [Polyangium aurulentum]